MNHSGIHNIDIDDEKLNKIEEACQLFDKDNDGLITLSELKTVLRVNGHKITESRLADLLNLKDKEESASEVKVDYKDFFDLFIKTMSYYSEKEKEDDIINHFKNEFDREGNGCIQDNELRHLFAQSGEKLTDDEINEILRIVDPDRDGYIKFEDYVRYMFAK